MSQSEKFDNSTNITVNTVSFIMKNNEYFSVDCSVLFSMSNGTNRTSNTGYVGVLKSGYVKNVSFHFVMYEGNASLAFNSKCFMVEY